MTVHEQHSLQLIATASQGPPTDGNFHDQGFTKTKIEKTE